MIRCWRQDCFSVSCMSSPCVCEHTVWQDDWANGSRDVCVRLRARRGERYFTKGICAARGMLRLEAKSTENDC